MGSWVNGCMDGVESLRCRTSTRWRNARFGIIEGALQFAKCVKNDYQAPDLAKHVPLEIAVYAYV